LTEAAGEVLLRREGGASLESWWWKYSGRRVQIAGETAPIIAEAINAIYCEMGIERRIEVRYDKRNDAPYIQLTNIDLELLGLK